MENKKLRTALTVLGVIILVILMASVVYGLIRSFTGGESDDNKSNETAVEESAEEQDAQLEEDAKNGKVTFYARGPIVAREEHYEVKVTIDRNQRNIEVYKGYQKTPIEKGSFPNDTEAFTQFLYAAKRAGLFSVTETDIDKNGYCYRGEVRTYTTSGFKNDTETWANGCNEEGTLSNDQYLLRLIKDQFPNYGEYVDQI